MRHDEHYVEALTARRWAPDRPHGPDRADRPEPEPAAAGDGRPVGADGVDRREGDHRAARSSGSAAAGSRSSPASGATRRRSRSGSRELPVVHPRRRRHRGDRARARREPPAQGPDAVRGGRGAARRWRTAAATRTRSWRRRLGKSRTSITESLVARRRCPRRSSNLCRLADISSKSLLLEIVRQSDPAKMMALVEQIARPARITREAVRQETASRRRATQEPTSSSTGRRQSVPSQPAVQRSRQVAPRRDHPRARSDPHRAAEREVGPADACRTTVRRET